MKTLFLSAIFLTVTVMALPARAQSDALEGTWSGHWVPEGRVRDAVTVRFNVDDEGITGEIVNPEPRDFDSISFDGDDLHLTARAGDFTIDARIEEETRLNGTFADGSDSGQMKLTKWTYVPRIR